MLIDIIIILFTAGALYRGRLIGFTRQLGSTAGFFGGLFLGIWLEPRTSSLVHGQTSRTLVMLLTTLGCAFILMAAGEYIGLRLKRTAHLKRINSLGDGPGALLGGVSLLFSAWLIAAGVLGISSSSDLQMALQDSRIISGLNRWLPPAPSMIADLGHLTDANGFPEVFIDGEPSPHIAIGASSLGALQTAIDRARASVVKVEGRGCGGIAEGSGFVAGPNLVATNAHVVAGIRHPYVKDGGGLHSGTVIWFNPNLDFAVLRVNNLAGQSLSVANGRVKPGTLAAVLGYPGSRPLTAGSAAVLDEFIAVGRNIYGHGNTNRDVYEIQADVVPGNSGGPLVAKDGRVIGVIFAESPAYQHVGYALTARQVASEINRAVTRSQAMGTSDCAE